LKAFTLRISLPRAGKPHTSPLEVCRVLDRDYMTVPAAEIKAIQPTMTMVGGRVVFQK